MKEILTNNVFFGIILTLIAFEIGQWLFKKTQSPIFNPFLVAAIFVIGTIYFFNIPTENYARGGDTILMLLSPATVVLAVPLYKQWGLFKIYFIPVLVGAVAGSFVGIITVIILGKLMGINDGLIFSLMPKSITTPIGIEVSTMIGGIPAITVVGIIVTGITGNVSAPLISRIFRIQHSVAVGIGIGVSSHAVGTSKAMEIGEIEGSMSALSIVFAGILTLVWAPILKFLV